MEVFFLDLLFFSEFSYFSENNQFQIHYDTEGSNSPDLADLNSNDIPDYVEEVAIIAEDSRHTLINIMGYLAEPDDEDGIYDIYIVNQTAWGWNVLMLMLCKESSCFARRFFSHPEETEDLAATVLFPNLAVISTAVLLA